MVQRSSRSAFMPSAHVFPGGRLEPSDAALPLRGGAAERERMLRGDPGLESAGAWQAAAIRETFEEAGVLLGDGEVDDADRDAVQAGLAGFDALVGQRGWSLDAERLVYWAWWITPQFEPRRFDTRFFVAQVPEGQAGRHDDRETVRSAWWTPQEALHRFDRGEVQLAPPTLVTLLELAPYAAVAEVLEAGRRREVTPIQPRGLLHLDGSISILLPGDELFPSERPVVGPTRVTLRDGRWLVRR